MMQRETYMTKIRPFIDSDLIKVITGIRRSGKSVMLQLIEREIINRGVAENQVISINFENMSNLHLTTAVALHDEIKEKISHIHGKSYLFFDEIQEVDHWEKCINSFRVEFDCDIYITGSNAKLLSGELATYLAGRYVEFVIYPFSYKEFIQMYRNINSSLQDREIFNKYLTLGGMPYLYNLRYEEVPSKQYLQDLYNSVVLKDILKRNNIRDIDLLERVISYITTNIGTTFSATSISKYFKSEGRIVSVEVILNYIKACEDAFLLYKVKRQDIQGKKILKINEKYYFADLGVREAVFGHNLNDINLKLENIVYLEMLRHGYKVYVGKINDKEIDFIGELGDKKIYIQVSYLLVSEDTINREFGVYDNVKDNFPKYVISMDEFDMSRNGIKHFNIRDFLLKESWE